MNLLRYSIFIFVLTIGIGSCKKDMNSNPSTGINECPEGLNFHSTDTFEYVWSDLQWSGSGGGPFYFNTQEFAYTWPTLNPINENQFAYSRVSYPPTLNTELWTFNLCNSEQNLIHDQFYYNLDWGSNDWLLFNGEGFQAYKIKSNGDSLKLLSSEIGFIDAGKWNPSSSLYWLRKQEGLFFYNQNDSLIHISTAPSMDPIDWISDSKVLGLGLGGLLHSLEVPTDELSLLNNNPISINGESKYIDVVNMYCYSSDPSFYLLRYTLDGSNEVDTVKHLRQSYKYVGGSYSNGKIATRLILQSWKDSLLDEFNSDSYVLILNPDGTDERLLEIPQ